MLNAENNILKAFKNEVSAQNGKEIATGDAEKLVQHVDKIIKGIEEGPQWILQENSDMRTIDPELISRMEIKITKIQDIIAELNARNVPIEVKTIDASELGDKSSSNKINKNNNTEVKAFAPVIVIVVLGVEYVLLPAAAGALEAYADIYYLEDVKKVYVCPECKMKIYGIRIGTAIATGLVDITAVKIGLLLKIYKALDILIDIGAGLVVDDLKSHIICDDINCYFYSMPIDITSTVDSPGKVRARETCTINTHIFNEGVGNASSFKVSLYVAEVEVNDSDSLIDLPPDAIVKNYTLIGTQAVSGLSGENNKTLHFNWNPPHKGIYKLKVVADESNEIKETDELNNEDTTIAFVNASRMVKCDLYKTKVVNSTSDPSVPFYKVYYFKAERPVLLQSWDRTPTFMYTTGDPVYSPVGFQAFYPYGGIWQYYADSPDGPWNICFFNPYAVCEPGVTQYNVDHWAMGSGYHQYFAVLMCTTPGPWESCQIKTGLNELWLYDKAA